MTPFKSIVALSAVALVTACASPGGTSGAAAAKADEHAGHHPDAAATAAVPGMQERMKTMRAMHDKMMNAKTPAERQALMADHMKAMQDGMAMMKSMGGMGGMGSMGAMSGMGDGKGMPADMAKRHQMMEGRMDMMQMMMDMMMQRLPVGPTAP